MKSIVRSLQCGVLIGDNLVKGSGDIDSLDSCSVLILRSKNKTKDQIFQP